METLSAEEIRALDDKAQSLGLSERVLVENASSNLSAEIEKLSLGLNVLVVAGRGNNGADVLSCSRKLFGRGYNVVVVVLENKPLGKEALFQKNILGKIKIPLYSLSDNRGYGKLKDFLAGCDFVLEGILGIGIKGELSDFYKEVISLINGSARKVISCDIPSGLHPDDGRVFTQAIKADYTISFIASKKGFSRDKGPECCGKVIVTDIGISKKILEDIKL